MHVKFHKCQFGPICIILMGFLSKTCAKSNIFACFYFGATKRCAKSNENNVSECGQFVDYNNNS